VRGINRYGRASQGVRLMNLKDDDTVSAVALVAESETDTAEGESTAAGGESTTAETDTAAAAAATAEGAQGAPGAAANGDQPVDPSADPAEQ
jgi:DNA gyrase subunit A